MGTHYGKSYDVYVDNEKVGEVYERISDSEYRKSIGTDLDTMQRKFWIEELKKSFNKPTERNRYGETLYEEKQNTKKAFETLQGEQLENFKKKFEQLEAEIGELKKKRDKANLTTGYGAWFIFLLIAGIYLTIYYMITKRFGGLMIQAAFLFGISFIVFPIAGKVAESKVKSLEWQIDNQEWTLYELYRNYQ